MTHHWQLPEIFREQFLTACRRAATDDKAFASFRQDPYISTVIENTNKEWADKALEKMGYTPTMVRYWYTARLIADLLPMIRSVVEIGGGYGGMCYVMSSSIEMHDYTIIDLPEANQLQRRYLDSVGCEASLQTSMGIIRGDICLSWCAWSELSLELREEYAEKVISKCDHFFFCCNYNYEEDKAILRRYFPDLKEYEDELVKQVIYA